MSSMVRWVALWLLAGSAASAWSQEFTPTELTCDDFRPTEAAKRRFPDLEGACQAVVEHEGELYGEFRAIVRRARPNEVTLYLPVTDHTFVVRPEPDARVLIGTRRVRPRELERGDEVQIYLSKSAFATPNVQEVALASDTGVVVEHTVTSAAALPTTASPWHALGLFSLTLLGLGYGLRRWRLRRAPGRAR
jgi:hypothetical protein